MSVSTGGASTCAITTTSVTATSGQLYCWGAGSRGRLGRNRANDVGTAIPALVTALKSDVTDVDVGQAHACAVLKDTTVKCWGANNIGQLGNGHPDIKGSGAIIARAGATTIANVTLAGSGTIRVGTRVTVTTGTVTNFYIPVATTVAAVTGSGPYTVTLSKAALQPGSGLDVTFSDINPYVDQPAHVAVNNLTGTGALTGAKKVSAGYGHTCALLDSGEVNCWGDGGNGRLGRGSTVDSTYPVTVTGITDAIDVSAGYIHSCAVLIDTRVKCWGSNRSGQLGDNTTTSRSTPVFVKTADPEGGPPIALTGAAKVFGAYGHTCAVMTDKTVDCWGSNQFNELGDPDFAETDDAGMLRPSPIARPVPNLTGVIELSTSYLHTCAITQAKKTYCWGHNTQGDAATGDFASPVTAPSIVNGLATESTKISAGNGYTCAIGTATGTFKSGAASCWGFGGNGQRGDGTTDKSPVPVPIWGGPNIDIVPPPTPTFLVRPDPRTKSRTANFSFRCAEAGVSFKYQIDGAAFVAAPNGTVTIKKLKPGPHQINLIASDIYGNASPPGIYKWTIV